MKRLTRAAVILLSLVPATPGRAAGPLHDALGASDKLLIEGSIRARFEVIDGQFRPGIADSSALLVRSILRAEYDAGGVRLGGELQDARVYLAQQPSSVGTTEIDTFEFIQAYVVGEIAEKAEVKLGRMTMDWGSRRLVSRQNFRNSTNAFTGVRFDWQPAKGNAVTLFWTMPHERLPNDKIGLQKNKFTNNMESLDLQFFGARAETANVLPTVAVETYLYRLAEQDSQTFLTRNRRLWTGGLRLLKAPKPGQFDVEVEAILQGGTSRASLRASDTTDLDVEAYFIHASVGHTFDASWSPRLVLSYDRASGNRPNGKFGRFDTLFGARVFEYGPSSLYGLVGRANLSSPEARLEVKPDKKWDGYFAVRPLWLESATDTFSSSGLRDESGLSGRYAGTQFDARARYWVIPGRVRAAAGAVLLAKGRFLETAPRAPENGNTHYGYTEVTVSF